MSFLDYLCEVTEVKPLDDYKLRVTCSDGATGIFDMEKYLDHGEFRALREPGMFKSVRIVAGAPTWSNGMDIAPERVRSDMVVA
ncbi:hypothetical protein Uis1B_0483 [Bifidobacterium margollesii]|uniref:DUF2442 domain-containing protein n=1 Tax=Bifidobacterium margollesii TaxID=2020964 RepID=A0A2N5JBS3_9BIFI|nr:DUF2442 domain-containing protein [Bifidobacterium margollesii]PLS31662.1 hypothetical protein Uis1B_0483 [Bifidobacterium margollesii]